MSKNPPRNRRTASHRFRRRLFIEELESRALLTAILGTLENDSQTDFGAGGIVFQATLNTPQGIVGTGIPDVTVNEDAADSFIRLRDWFDDQPGGAAGLTFAIHAVNPPGAPIFSSIKIETGMADTRTAFTATRLANGKVLVTGGFYWDGSQHVTLASAELYDPVSQTWTLVAPMHVGRSEQQAALLADGRVLVCGGNAEDGATVASAEIYNPATNTWTVVNPMSTVRAGHTATGLASGKVLVVGGAVSGDLKMAELYDPATNSWSAAGALANWRWRHTATALVDGSVVVSGGLEGSFVSASAERYDPVANTWSAAGTMTAERIYHTSTLLADGTVLVTGGNILQGALASAERYHPASNTWTAAATMNESRQSHTATLLADGRVLVVGGENGTGPTVDTAEIYNPLLNNWTPADTIANARSGHGAMLLTDGSVLIAGGLDFAGGLPPDTLATSELFNPAAGLWTRTAPVLRLGYTKDEFGSAQITIRATDAGGASLDDTFDVTVNPVNDVPKFEPGLDPTVNDNSGPQSIANWATQISQGPANEATQTVSFVIHSNSNPALFATPPAIDASGRLTFAPAPNAHGTANITIKLTDSGGTANGGVDTSPTKTFTVTVIKPHKWHNTLHALDVTGTGGQPDARVVAADALAIINYINAFGAGQVPAAATYGPPYVDTTGDDFVLARDALEVINFINAFGAGLPGPAGEGEAQIESQQTGAYLPSDLLALIASDIAEQALNRRRAQV